MLKEIELKEILQTLALTDFKPADNTDVNTLIPDILRYIGSIDYVLRDELIYPALSKWILEYKLLSSETLRDMAMKAISEDFILYKIGEVDSDSVFRRSFSMLLLPLILIHNRSHPFLTKEEIFRIKGCLMRYEKEEKDHRGYVDGKGWAHSAAHYPDALDDLARCSEMDGSDLREILYTVSSLLCQQDFVYCWGEDNRCATVILAILGRHLLSDEEFDQWICSMADKAMAVTVHPQKLIMRSNVNNFLQSLYFRIQWEFPGHATLSLIERALYRISLYTQK